MTATYLMEAGYEFDSVVGQRVRFVYMIYLQRRMKVRRTKSYLDLLPAPFFGGPFPAALSPLSFFCHLSCFSVSVIGLPSMLSVGFGYQLVYKGPLSGRRRIFWPERCPGPTGFLRCPHTSRATSSSERPVVGHVPARICAIFSSSEREDNARAGMVGGTVGR
ncbi:unnamed protein product [Chondrus crispus]|uniref:Uncharacterized protein n=1 Tax=Chondrus crispus TaxID=2769 RepID=R7QJ58_CHOCR|nr:unnamed protein product [Chondrus crispus]CDF38129.1 unnamed protein product [Chondrus crispus]|eukprot:XP_005717998.1 unnamed protein product [Chondrus crispus]